mmetsp:Transcript_7730/g.19712  ORF Transcript_7730/g.19712 Transcript_7730/m.19712 type:complete len:301 (-) Transcript_7730:1102-2004(-)
MRSHRHLSSPSRRSPPRPPRRTAPRAHRPQSLSPVIVPLLLRHPRPQPQVMTMRCAWAALRMARRPGRATARAATRAAPTTTGPRSHRLHQEPATRALMRRTERRAELTRLSSGLLCLRRGSSGSSATSWVRRSTTRWEERHRRRGPCAPHPPPRRKSRRLPPRMTDRCLRSAGLATVALAAALAPRPAMAPWTAVLAAPVRSEGSTCSRTRRCALPRFARRASARRPRPRSTTAATHMTMSRATSRTARATCSTAGTRSSRSMVEASSPLSSSASTCTGRRPAARRARSSRSRSSETTR